MKLASTWSVLTLTALAVLPAGHVALAGDNAARADAAAKAALGDAAADAADGTTVGETAAANAAAVETGKDAALPDDDGKGVVDDDAPLALDAAGTDSSEMLQGLDDGVDANQAADDYLKATSVGIDEQASTPVPSALTVEPKMPLHATENQRRTSPTSVKPDVAALQKALNANGAGLAVDGKMGRATRVALTSFQKQHGLSPTGELTPQTLSALGLSAR